jgi:DNA-binding GntR family transcriptional regulator
MAVDDKRRIALIRIGYIVADQLRTEIVTGQLRPGVRLNVAEIAARLGVSRTPVDDGLRLLESEGLVVIAPRRGTFVAEVNIKDLTEIFEIRIVFEQLAIRAAFDRGETPDLSPLYAHLAELEETAQSGDVERHSRANAEFHEYLVELSGNRRLVALYGQLSAPIAIARIHSRTNAWRGRVEQDLAEHALIIESMEARKVDAASAAMEQHLRRGLASLIADLGDDATDEPRRRPTSR